MTSGNYDIKGLSDQEVLASRNKNGENSVTFKTENHFLTAIIKFLKDPMILIVFAMIIYPILGYYFGHIYPNSPSFGLPCPTTIFTFGLLLLNRNRSPIWILIIPFAWSVIGFSAVFQFGVLEDSSLIVASLILFCLLIYQNRKMVD